MNYETCYKVLRLPPNSPFDMVKKAYRQYVHIYHPDVCAQNTNHIVRFKEIQEAYQILRELSLRSDVIVHERYQTDPYHTASYPAAPLAGGANPVESRGFQPHPEATKTTGSERDDWKRPPASRYINIEVDIITRNLPTKALIERMTDSDNKFVRMAAAKSLFPRKSARNLLHLLGACNDPDSDVSEFVLTLLTKYFDFEGLSYLSKIWEISSQAQKFKLLVILEKLYDPKILNVIKEMDRHQTSFITNKIKRFFMQFGRAKFSL